MSSTGAGRDTRWQTRAPRDSDLARWRELYQAYADFYRAPQPGTAAQRVWSLIRNPHHELNCLLAADETGEIAGLAHYRAFTRPLAASTGCFLDDLFVDDAHRGSGAVDTLLLELRRTARANGWTVIRWITAHDNTRAIAAYNRHATRTGWLTYDMPPAET